MKKSLFIFPSALVLLISYSLNAETITAIDRDALFSRYKPPKYQVSMEKLSGLTLEQAQKYLKSDIYDYVMSVQTDYMEKNKLAIPLFYPQHTHEKINAGILKEIVSEADLTEEKINKKAYQDISDYLNIVNAMHRDPVYKTINDLYFEVIGLKAQLAELKSMPSQRSAILSNSDGTQEGKLVSFASLVLSFIAILIAWTGRSKNNKK